MLLRCLTFWFCAIDTRQIFYSHYFRHHVICDLQHWLTLQRDDKFIYYIITSTSIYSKYCTWGCQRSFNYISLTFEFDFYQQLQLTALCFWPIRHPQLSEIPAVSMLRAIYVLCCQIIWRPFQHIHEKLFL